MRIIDILDPVEMKEFESPPIFSYQQRKVFFNVPDWLKTKLQGGAYPINDVGLLLQLGYFKSSGRFFRLSTFHEHDIAYVCRILKADKGKINLSSYSSSSQGRHRDLILAQLGFHKFTGSYKSLAIQEANHLSTRQFSPASIFRSLCEFIRSHSTEVPSYNTLAVIITQALRNLEKILLQTISTQLSEKQKAELDGLFDKLPDDILGRNTYKISRYKTLHELMKLSAIRENMDKLRDLKALYHLLDGLIIQLNISEELIEYYANYVLSAHVFQVKQRAQKYLLLICFVKYQYLYLNDMMIQTFMSTTQQTLRQADNRKNELLLQWQQDNQVSQEKVLLAMLAEAPLIRSLQDTAYSLEMTQEEKYRILIENIKNPQHDQFLKLVPAAENLYQQSVKSMDNKLLYQSMIEKSRAFQKRVSPMLRHVEFTAADPGDKVMNALKFYQKKQGDLTPNAPVEFLNKQERQQVQQANNGFNEPLYKVLLAKYINKSLKSGRIIVGTSHQFKAFEEYMIDQAEWINNRENLLDRAAITYLKEWKATLGELEDRLADQLRQTFMAINTGQNPFVKKRKNNTLRFITPKQNEPVTVTELYPQDLYVPIFEVLHTVNQHTEFTKKLTHKMQEYRRDIMPDTANFASIIGWGCNLGIGLMAKRSKNISLSALEKTSNWHLSSKNLLQANDKIVALMDTMPIHSLFKEQEDLLRSASDGQKFTMALNSIHANYSSKYFGKEKGIIIYSFMAEHYPVFYTTTFSAGDFEAWYILDGLLHYQPVLLPTANKKDKGEKQKGADQNQDPDSDWLHSTDQHGISYINSALCYLLKIDFQPRFKTIHKVKLYGTTSAPINTQSDYQIKTSGSINTKIIEEQWDNILRLLATLKLKHTIPSVLLKRLTSYPNKHPLNLALVELGKLVQSIFVLKYMDQQDLRRRINHQLTQV